MSGVASHSKPSANYVIFSVPNMVLFNAIHTRLLADDIGHKPIYGRWHGLTEPGFIVSEYIYDTYITPKALAKGQNCVLRLGAMDARGRREATLRYLRPDGTGIPEWDHDIGLFQSVRKDQKNWSEDWTYDPLANELYRVFPKPANTMATTAEWK